MAKLILSDCRVKVDDIELSDHASSVTINSSKDLVDTTSFGASYKSNLVGLGDASIDVTFFQDFDSASVDATLWPLHSDSTVFSVEIIPTSDVVSASNPSYKMAEAVLPSFSPLNGKVGDASTVDASFKNAGQSGIVKSSSGS